MSASGALAIVPAPAFDPQEPLLTRIGGRAWSSWHLYGVGPGDYLHVVSTVIPAVVRQLSARSLIDGFFFIRYADAGGHHVRLRLRAPEGAFDTIEPVARVVEGAAEALGLTALLQPFELEVERYGGMAYLPLSLELFCLSSLAVLDWCECHAAEPRSRQLPEVMRLLVSQAAALARDLNELALLLDYFAGWREQMEASVQKGDRVFENQAERLVSLLRLNLDATLSGTVSQAAMIKGARALSAAVRGLPAARRNEVLLSQMHMTANRLGLHTPEESYVTQILRRALERLVQQDPGYARDLDARLRRQRSSLPLDALVSRCLEKR